MEHCIVDESYRLIPVEPDLPAPSWHDFMRSQPAGEGFHVNLIDCWLDEDEVRILQGPPTFSISLFLEGSGRFSAEGGPLVELAPRTMFLFYADRPVYGLNHADGGHAIRAVDFRFDLSVLKRVGLNSVQDLVGGFPDNASTEDVILMRRPLDTTLTQIAEQSFRCEMQGPAYWAFMQSRALEMLSHLIRLGDHGWTEKLAIPRKDRLRLESAARLIETRYDESWTIPSLARTVGVNERKLKCGFREMFGHTVHDHLEITRMDAAKKMLLEEQRSVADTAVAVGYSNPSYFAKVFRRHTGQSPRYWRTGV